MNPAKKLRIIFSIVGISFIQGLQFSVSPVLDKISAHFPEVDVSLVQMLITAPSFVAMIFALLSGVLVLKFSKKSLLIVAGLLAGISGFVPFLADSFCLLFVCRAVYGISLGIATALNTAVVAEWFTGPERTQVMGIQAASVGAGMVVVTTVGGLLGAHHFTTSYLINIIGFLSFAVIAAMLPASEHAKEEKKTEKIRLNGRVFEVSLLGFFEYLFLITFTTNISMHLAGALKGSSSASGTLAGIFSGAQIVIGLLLGVVSRVAKKYTLPVAMFSFAVGAGILVAFPGNFAMLAVGAVFCGFSQGIFIPTGMVEVSNAVPPIAAALASGCFTCFTNFGQTVSPFVLNTASRGIFGEVTTSHVYMLSAVGVAIAGLVAVIRIRFRKSKKKS